MASSSVFWKGVKFWLTLLLAAYAAAAVTWLLLRENDGAVQQAQGDKPASAPTDPTPPTPPPVEPIEPIGPMVNPGAPQDVAVDAAAMPSPKDWAIRMKTARGGALLAATQLGVPEPAKWVGWVVEASIPNLREVLAADSVSREKAACLAEMEWLLQALTRELSEARPKDLDLATLEHTLLKSPPKTLHEAARWSAVLRARGTDASRLHTMLMRRWLTVEAGRNDVFVRTMLGYVAFDADTHPDLGFRRYDFVETVEHAVRKRWFAAQEQDALQVAQLASKVFDRHFERYASDHAFRAVENMRANLFQDARLDGLYLRTHSDGAYLICYLSDRNLGPDSRVGFQPATSGDRKVSLDELRQIDELLKRRGKLYQSVNRALRARFAAPLGLKPLSSRWGGRPDYPMGVRSYADGVVSTVLLVDGKNDDNRFLDWDRSAGHPPAFLGQMAAGWLEGSVIAIDRDLRHTTTATQRETDHASHAHAAVRQIWYWSARQASNWRHPAKSHPFAVFVLASFFEGITFDESNRPQIRAHNGLQLLALRTRAKPFQDAGTAIPWTKLEQLLRDASMMPRWARTWNLGGAWRLSAMDLFRSHAKGFASWTDQSETRKKQLHAWLGAVLGGEDGPKSQDAFHQAFGTRDPAVLRDVQQGFERSLESLLQRSPEQWRSSPPSLDDSK